MPAPTSGPTATLSSVEDALCLLATKNEWSFDDLPDWFLSPPLLRRLSIGKYIEGCNKHDRSVFAFIHNQVRGSTPFPEGFAIPRADWRTGDTWESPEAWDWVRCVELVSKRRAIGPDIRLTNLGWIKAEDLRAVTAGQGGEGAVDDAISVAGYASADTLEHDYGIIPARLSEAKSAGKVKSKPAPAKMIDSDGKSVRVLYHVEDAKKHCSPNHVKKKTTPVRSRRS